MNDSLMELIASVESKMPPKRETMPIFGGDKLPFGDMAQRTQEQIDWDDAWAEVSAIAPGLKA